jgi:energy-coupling factor transporter ATPase
MDTRQGALIRVQGLRVVYDVGSETPIEALRGVDLCVQAGEWVAVVGHNGSGKSTLAKCLNGLLAPTQGDVWVRGLNTRQREHLLAIRRTVGIVLQNPDNQFVATTVEEEAAFGPENLGLPHRLVRQRVDEALHSAGLEGLARANPHELSAGQKGRLAIASVLAMAPECLILDESTAFLDPLAREGVLAFLARQHQAGLTLMSVTHDMDEALLADRMVVMAAGRVAFDATPRELFAHDALDSLGLGAPTALAVASGLRRRGLALPAPLLTAGELAEALLASREATCARP